MSKKIPDPIKKKINIPNAIISFVIAIVSLTIDVVVINGLANSLQASAFVWVAIILIVVTVGLFIAIWFIFKYLTKKSFNKLNWTLDTSSCKYEDKPCCSIEMFKAFSNAYNLPVPEGAEDALKKEYSAYLAKHLISIEENFKSKNGKEIWIISTTLDSEIFTDESLGATHCVKDNVNAGVDYYYVYADIKKDPARIERNKKNILDFLDNNEHVHFISMGSVEDSLSDYIYNLYGVVIYVNNDDTYEGYFSIRKEGIDAIYIKMPICMAGKYIHQLRKLNERGNDVDLEYKQSSNMSRQAMNLRHDIFVNEQGIPFSDEFDGLDDKSDTIHCDLSKSNKLLAYARIWKISDTTARFGRIVVSPEERRKGYGQKIIRYALSVAIEKGYKEVKVEAQVQAIDFYEKCGFIRIGEAFVDAGIPHIWMMRNVLDK